MKNSDIFVTGAILLATRAVRDNDIRAVIDLAGRITNVAPENAGGRWFTEKVADLVPPVCPIHGVKLNWVSE